MKRAKFYLAVSALVAGMVFGGCMDRQPAAICPVPIQMVSETVSTNDFDGVDLLVVVDNSASMKLEQETLSTGFFTLLNSLTKPLTDGSWEHKAVENVRVAIVTSDMGLQYGPERKTEASPTSTPGDTCTNLVGDDGMFQTDVPPVTTVLDDIISCEEGGGQCPTEYACVSGKCQTTGSNNQIACNFGAIGGYAEIEAGLPNPTFTEQLACLAIQGIDGCAFEQQLEASVRALEREEQAVFMKPSHLLAILIVSDEEDCSIENPLLFKTDEWTGNNRGPTDPARINVACNVNEQYLFNTTRYREKFLGFKNNQENAVVFAAIIGVPFENGDNTCQGNGTEILQRGCLDVEAMQLKEEPLPDSAAPSNHFRPACKSDLGDVGGGSSADARPGRRYVQVAQEFGSRGYVYSICNADWSPAMKNIAEIIAAQMKPTCFSEKLDWDVLSADRQALYPDCEGCGEAKCHVMIGRKLPVNTPKEQYCPEGLYEGLDDTERRNYKSLISVGKETYAGTTEDVMTVYCPVPKLPTDIICTIADQQIDTKYDGRVGWYYCENTSDDMDAAVCSDDIDNDNDGRKDCEDPECADCSACGGSSDVCREGCRYGLSLSDKAKTFTSGNSVELHCLQRFPMNDQNCREDSKYVCSDGNDNDGNGRWDCDSTLDVPGDPEPHLADPGCCPMTKDKDTGKCVPLMAAIQENCAASPSLSGQGAGFWSDPANARLVDACVEQKASLDCQW